MAFDLAYYYLFCFLVLGLLPCSTMAQIVGGDKCGLNSLYRLDDAGNPTCLCPNGYSYFDPDDKHKGCKQDFVPQSCDAGNALSSETDFDLEEIKDTNMPASDYAIFAPPAPVTEDWCRQSCLEDCFCAVIVFNDKGECYKKGFPFVYGRPDLAVNTRAFIKIRKGNSTVNYGGVNSKKKDDSTLIIVGSVLLSSLGILNFILPLITYVVVSRMYSRKKLAGQPYQGMNLKCYTYEELKEATNDFKEELGRGASAIVFKGVLACDKGKCVAVKIVYAKVGESDLEFNAEVRSIGRTNHRNLKPTSWILQRGGAPNSCLRVYEQWYSSKLPFRRDKAEL